MTTIARRTIMAQLPPLDWTLMRRQAGDLRRIVEADLRDTGHRGMWPCPFHDDGTASLSVSETNFNCFGCGAKGDAFDWVARRRGISNIDAARDLGVLAEVPGEKPKRVSGPIPPPPPKPPAAREFPGWQSTVDQFVRHYETKLWRAAGREALDWLFARGLDGDTIRRFRLGFNPGDIWTSGPVEGITDDHGKPRGLFVPRGITIPWVKPGAWYAESDGDPGGRWVGLNVRRLANPISDPLPEGVDKCLCIKGSTRGYLYPHADFAASQAVPALIVEGEFDALLAHQAAGHLVNAATAGGASTRRLPRESLAALARCPRWFLAFDHDAAGLIAAREWRAMAPHKAKRVLLPAGKDLTDFRRAGGDVAAWVRGLLSPDSTGTHCHFGEVIQGCDLGPSPF